jgi:hypothetical protein
MWKDSIQMDTFDDARTNDHQVRSMVATARVGRSDGLSTRSNESGLSAMSALQCQLRNKLGRAVTREELKAHAEQIGLGAEFIK